MGGRETCMYTPALLAPARVQHEVLAGLVERGGMCGVEGLLSLAGGWWT